MTKVSQIDPQQIVFVHISVPIQQAVEVIFNFFWLNIELRDCWTDISFAEAVCVKL